MERFGERGLKKFLNDEEIVLVKNPRNAAGFWAVKEAFSKALKTGISKELRFHDMRVIKTEFGAPEVVLSPEISKRFGISESSVSISHDGEYAVAIAIIKTE